MIKGLINIEAYIWSSMYIPFSIYIPLTIILALLYRKKSWKECWKTFFKVFLICTLAYYIYDRIVYGLMPQFKFILINTLVLERVIKENSTYLLGFPFLRLLFWLINRYYDKYAKVLYPVVIILYVILFIFIYFGFAFLVSLILNPVFDLIPNIFLLEF